MKARRLWFSFALVLGCSRTPPEPTPTPASVTATPNAVPSAGQTTTSGRCLVRLPPKAWPIPSAADANACPTDPEPQNKMPVEDVSFPETKALTVHAELAKTPHDVERGLMFRRTMADDQGMLFNLEQKKEHTFWMHNTCIPLDMLFVDDDGTIVGVVESAAPLTDTTRSVSCPSLYVLEVNAGWVRKHGVSPGQKITIPTSMR